MTTTMNEPKTEEKPDATASDTPRTDAAIETCPIDEVVHADFARQLERELNEANFHRKLSDLTGEKCVAELSILRREKAELREALSVCNADALTVNTMWLRNNGASGAADCVENIRRIAHTILAATKEKEEGK